MVCDAIMGSGKSQSAIAYMNKYKDRKFVYITPFLEECERIRTCCPELDFQAPKVSRRTGSSKVEHTRKLLEGGYNIATTHSAFRSYTADMIESIKKYEYTLIVDEAVDVFQEMDYGVADFEVLEDAGFIEERNGYYVRTDKPYSGGFLTELFKQLRSNNVIKSVSKDGSVSLFYWVIPKEILASFKDVIVLTYLFDSSEFKYFFDINGISYTNIGIQRDGDNYWFVDRPCYVPDYVKDIFGKINILDKEKLNEIGHKKTAISLSWLQAHKEEREQLQRHMYNFLHNICKSKANECLWSTYKSTQDFLQGRGYNKGYLVFNSKATNAYRDRKYLAYCVNIFEKHKKLHFFAQHGIRYDQDGAALSTMLQWIWRSAIRDGQPIEIYIPSRRMRTLLIDWMREVEQIRSAEGGIPL